MSIVIYNLFIWLTDNHVGKYMRLHTFAPYFYRKFQKMYEKWIHKFVVTISIIIQLSWKEITKQLNMFIEGSTVSQRCLNHTKKPLLWSVFPLQKFLWKPRYPHENMHTIMSLPIPKCILRCLKSISIREICMSSWYFPITIKSVN